MSSIFSREQTSFSPPSSCTSLSPHFEMCHLSSVAVPLFPFSNWSILCTSELSFPQYLRIVICLPLDIPDCFLSWLIRLQNRLCSCWFQLVTPLSVQMKKILPLLEFYRTWPFRSLSLPSVVRLQMAGIGKSKRHIPFCPFSDSPRRSQRHSFSKGLLTSVWAFGDLLC